MKRLGNFPSAAPQLQMLFSAYSDEKLDQMRQDQFPAGVTSFRQWSRTIFAFGRIRRFAHMVPRRNNEASYRKLDLRQCKAWQVQRPGPGLEGFLDNLTTAAYIQDVLFPETRKITYEGCEVQREFA